ncbi:16S rRNA (cytosine(1402)-N(4))-methyltransferase RsmH [Yanshouia hominis]|uniref:Ribosomal RNA small subunit methyltransferase H n=1 Tax=Yanshouia hominis TaxID=2763673 RepID=A0ABR7NF51_9FIRM|nr:16S rRNA (cytosine(1402)-N(4))-methyltransferase RsmH [Yanshouia hominis]MBC8575047.1 16S rRNA (cytosine(1402)-N(4))-methyltransferase RsmH [Yanshouia hominis]
MEFSHVSVLLHETIESLSIRPDGVYIDGTAGGAGHSCEIASRLTTGRLIAIDKDPDAVRAASERLAPFPQARVVREDFRNLRAVAEAQGILRADGILLDLGVSSQQLDDAARGFSYHSDAPLDMRMSQSGMSAYDLVNGYDERSITRILRDYGEERFAARIARAIVQARSSHPIETTLQLAELIKEAIPAATRREGGHPAKRSFQAIRIEVNGELTALEGALDQAFDLLSVGGRLSIITFHSLEDRMVKRRFAVYTEGCTCPAEFPVCVCGKTPRGRLLAKKPVTASEEELARNHRSRSAKLRCIEKIKD